MVRHASDDTHSPSISHERWPDARIAVQEARLGIADALCRALPLLGDAPAYLACACDSLFAAADIAAMIAAGGGGDAVVGVLDMGAGGDRGAQCRAGRRRSRRRHRREAGARNGGVEPRRGAPLLAAARRRPPPRADATQGAERYVSVALAAYLRAGGAVRALRLRERLEVTTAADVDALAARLRSG